MTPHRIRLPAPWRVIRAPAALAETGGSFVFHRSFQRPTGLTSQSVIALEVTLLEPLAIDVALNGSACSIVRRSELGCEVPLSPDQLNPVNELEITVHLPTSAGQAAITQPKLGQDYLSEVALVLSA